MMPQVSPVRHRAHNMSPTRTPPTGSQARKAVPQGFISYKPKQKPIKDMSIRELQDLHARNSSILSEPYVYTLDLIDSQ